VDSEIPVELLERELNGMDLELQELRRQHKAITDRIVELERERFALDCKIRAITQRQLPL
jgi:prefoldin subunit 5